MPITWPLGASRSLPWHADHVAARGEPQFALAGKQHVQASCYVYALALAEPAFVIVAVDGIGGEPDARPDVDQMAYLGVHPAGMDIVRVEAGVAVYPVAGMKHTIRASGRKASEEIVQNVGSLVLGTSVIVRHDAE
jgi:hypothetical protein